MLTMLKDAIVTPLTVVGRFPELFRSVRSDSLVEYTQVTRAEPIVLVDSSAVHLPYMGDVMQSLSAIFAGYYLQAIALSVNVGKIDTIKLLEKINPNRSPAENAGMLIGDIMVSEESYRDCLPNYGKLSRVISQEGIDGDDEEHYMTLGRTTTSTTRRMRGEPKPMQPASRWCASWGPPTGSAMLWVARPGAAVPKPLTRAASA